MTRCLGKIDNCLRESRHKDISNCWDAPYRVRDIYNKILKRITKIETSWWNVAKQHHSDTSFMQLGSVCLKLYSCQKFLISDSAEKEVLRFLMNSSVQQNLDCFRKSWWVSDPCIMYLLRNFNKLKLWLQGNHLLLFLC